jgi:hypothetical protein
MNSEQRAEALRLAALISPAGTHSLAWCGDAARLLRTLAEQQEQEPEPVAQFQHGRDGVWIHLHHAKQHLSINLSADDFTRKFAIAFATDHPQDAKLIPLYAAPVAQPLTPLTDEQIERIRLDLCDLHILGRLSAEKLARAIERAHGIGAKP